MKKWSVIWFLVAGIMLTGLVTAPNVIPAVGVTAAVNYFREQASLFAGSAAVLETTVSEIKPDVPETVVAAKNALKACRAHYKRIEFFLDYFFPSIAVIYNAAPVYEAEVPFMEYREPTGLQVIEALLFDEHPAARKMELLQQVSLISTSAADVGALLHHLEITDEQLLEVPTQTLSAKPLLLNENEVQDIISFLHSLTDANVDKL